MRNCRFPVALAALLLLAAGVSHATTYVAAPPLGDDLLGDGSPTSPFATIQHAYDQVTVQGDTIIVAPGTYNECVVATGQQIEVSPGVFEDKWVHIRANHPDNTLTTINGDGFCTTVTVGGFGGSVEGFTITGGGSGGVHGIGTVAVTDNIINGNTGFDGGGIQISSSTCSHGAGTVSITGNTITANHATDDGGGILVLAGVDGVACQTDNVSVVIQGNLVDGNTSDDDGGGVHATTTALLGFSADITIVQNEVRNNVAVHPIGQCCASGGGLRVRAAGTGTETIRVVDNIVDLNQSHQDGGGIEARVDGLVNADHTVIVDNNTVTGNISVDGDGGGILVKTAVANMAPGQRYDMIVTDNLVDNNFADGEAFGGGGILARFESTASRVEDAISARFLIAGNIITNNSTQLVGGGLSVSAEANIDDSGTGVGGCSVTTVDATSHIDVVNNLIARNAAIHPTSPGRGGGVAALAQACTSPATSGTLAFRLNTITHNETTLSAGGLEIGYFSIDGGFTAILVDHTIISDNQGVGLGGVEPTGNHALDITYSNVVANASTNYSPWIPNPTGTDGNITALVRYVDPVTDDFHLSDISPVIDAGKRIPGDVPVTDLDGNPRVVDGNEDGRYVIDMGYDEYFVCTDVDIDGYGDPVLVGDHCEADNCPADFNPGQSDCDTDLLGDVCDPDAIDVDEDGVAAACDTNDNDPYACGDLDGDTCEDCTTGVADLLNDGLDSDHDGLCDAGDLDDDDDGLPDSSDNCPLDPDTDQTDLDGDGLGDFCDPDDDNDGVDDPLDSAPLDQFVCRDADGDTCDDCTSGTDNPANDGTDTDLDGACDAGDPDDDNDGVDDPLDSDPFDAFVCRDTDGDTCDDCSSGIDNPADDGPDNDTDGQCDAGDPDDDNDGVDDPLDSDPFDAFVCRDVDGDTCDDCSSGIDNPADDGPDNDTDGQCDAGDPDDDNDGVDDPLDSDPFDAFVCRDTDGDTCDDCSSGIDNPGDDGADFDLDGLCDAGDPDDDNDGVDDVSDPEPFNLVVCGDADADTCDDCSSALLLDVHFDTDEDGFTYHDDPFRGTVEPAYADGSHEPAGGFSGGGLRVILGGIDDVTVIGMSGGWAYTLNLVSDTEVSLSFRYNLTQAANYEIDEVSQALLSVDGALIGVTPNDYIVEIVGDGNSEPNQSTGWQPFEVDLGLLSAGAHTIVIGGYNNQKTAIDEWTEVLIDDVVLVSGNVPSFDPANDGADNDLDGLCDAGDPDDDNDGVDDPLDSDPFDAFVCRDVDGDTCDDCSSGIDNPADDGPDNDTDGQCDAGDPDDDNDGVDDPLDSDPFDAFVCRDVDGDTCDDCSSGIDNPADDGADFDLDGQCDAGDPDDDNDGVDDPLDSDPFDAFVCRDVDGDTCDDCSSGIDNPADDGADNDTDGQCDAGDPDDDNDGVDDPLDSDPFDAFVCRDADGDTCDDCSSGIDNPADDGADNDLDGLCDAGDPDDDNDGVDDPLDSDPFDAFVCRDVDGDTCDDCSSGTDDPANDGADFDLDGLCDAGDPDDDNDGVDDPLDSDPFDAFVCRDADGDTCDDCSSGIDNPADDGPDNDTDGQCDAGDPDDDNDGVDDPLDSDPFDAFVCRDADGDTCDDCSSGVDNPADDGPDNDTDGQCDAGDPDDDNDGVDDPLDSDPFDEFVCRDADGDTCDDCSSGVDNPADDGPDNDTDGQCDAGDPDDDNDGVDDPLDSDPFDEFVCRDADGDTCDDCSSGVDNPADDGPDNDTDGQCDAGDPDDDNDGVDDPLDSDPFDAFVCRDADGDTCDDCSSGIDDPADDGPDNDTDGLCDAGDPDDDNDGVDDPLDSDPFDAFVCRDADGDTCDDCSSGIDDPADDGPDNDTDGLCDAGDPDDDNDGVDDPLDSDPFDEFVCRDVDGDTCDDCSSGIDNPADDGPDNDTDGQCDAGDPDDDNDGVDDPLDSDPFDAFVCRDVDGDTCDDCSSGIDNPADDGPDNDTDGQCDAGDPDDDNDGVDDPLDSDPFDAFVCRDVDGDTCDDCSSGIDNPADDGPDNDTDGQCDAGDPDDDNDGVDDPLDSDPFDAFVCRDVDGDTCDDCSSGTDDPANDGADFDLDGLCDAGDPDDDNDGVDDPLDSDPFDAFVCRDADGDTCDDCSSGIDNPADDGPDNDTDGQCDAGDPDDDNDGVDDPLDSDPFDAFVCRDVDGDTCDDCSSGIDNPADDGPDNDTDGQCDAGDPDDDNDGVDDPLDSDPFDAFVCRDADGDTCDDCSSGTDDPANDGADFDLDGLCDAGDPDDDNDGAADVSDCAPFVNSISAPAEELGDTVRLGPAKNRIAWLKTPNANVYNVYLGTVPSGGPFAYNHACFLNEVTTIEASDDTTDPASGEIRYYLVSGTNVCGGDGGLGTDSASQPRPNDTPCVPQGNDGEGDGVLDINDNCPEAVNPLQEDDDLDRRGNVCDNCPLLANLDQQDSDIDSTGDVCDSCTDGDGDGYGDPGFVANTCEVDNCPTLANPEQLDADADDLGDACDACPTDPNNDVDGDGHCGDVDNCPNDSNLNQADSDIDGIGDVCDPCGANPDTQCVACPAPQTTDPDADGFCQIGAIVVEEGAAMDYLTNASDPGIGLDWIEEGFTLDASWQSGVYGIGFDTDPTPPNAQDLITTPVAPGTHSIYTRLTFEVADASDVDLVTVSADYDDAYVAWVNGIEVFRSTEMPPGDPVWQAGTLSQREPSNGTDPDYGPPNDVTAAAQSALHNGTNTLAVGVWNASAGSSDLVLVPRLAIDTSVDNCPDIANPGQDDADGDQIGDLCDNCVNAANLAQIDADEDGMGDACDPCPGDPNPDCGLCPPGTDGDGDGVCQLETIVVEEGASMDYLANSSDPGIALTWTEEIFTPGPGWAAGVYGVGYDSAVPPNALGLISTTVADTSARSIYTRAEFDIADVGEALRVLVAADYDDGYMVWINGTEVFRSAEMPVGDPGWTTFAAPHESSNQADPEYGVPNDVTTAALAAMHNGTNVMAVGIWNANATSSDLVVVPRLSYNTTLDNCPNTSNPSQADTDGDGIGDACDPD